MPDGDRQVTFVKKVLADGSPCRKCADVERRLTESGLAALVDRTLVADERDPASEGLRLAADLGVDRAPFFVVDEDGERTVHTVYFRFAKAMRGDADPSPTGPGDRSRAARDILDAHPDLDQL